VKSLLGGKDPVQLAEDGLQQSRATLAEARGRLQKQVAELEAGQRPEHDRDDGDVALALAV
jgi:hypothetical protein